MKPLLLSLSLALASCGVVYAGEEVTPLVVPEVEELEVSSLMDPISVASFVSYSDRTEEFGAGIRLAYDINDHVVVRVDYIAQDFKVDSSTVGASTSATLQFSYPLKNAPFNLQPYVITGTTVSSFDAPEIGAIIGAGIGFDITEQVNAFLEYDFAGDSEDQFSTARVGVSFSF